MNSVKRFRFIRLLSINLAICLSVYIFVGLFQYFSDRKLPVESFKIEDLNLVALVDKHGDGSYVATDSDPAIIISGERKVKKIAFSADYYVEAGEVVAFYKTRGDIDYSIKNCIIPHRDGDSFVFDFGSKTVTELRIDPTSVGGNKIYFGEVVINGDISIGDYISFSTYTIFAIFVVACFMSCATEYCHRFFKEK